MANAVKKEFVAPPPPYEVVLTLTQKEAETLMTILGRIGGCPYNSPRGLADQVAEVLGLQYEAFEELEEKKRFYSDKYHREIRKRLIITDQINEMESWGLWKRIKCVFTGIKRV